MDFVFQIIGIFGAAFVLVGFSMMKFNKWKNEDLSYNIANGVGSILLVINAIYFKNIAFFILNAFWTVLSIKDIVKLYTNKVENK